MDPLLGQGCARRSGKLSKTYNRNPSIRKMASKANSASQNMAASAAAMLSLKWPPEKDVESESGDLEDYESDGANGNIRSKRNLSKKATEVEEEKSYVPFHMPSFDQVQTAWPGFVHEPVPNWQHKYMIAKPVPRWKMDMLHDSLPVSDETTSKNAAYYETYNAAKVPTKYSKSKDSNEKPKSSQGSRRLIRIERNGSCVK